MRALQATLAVLAAALLSCGPLSVLEELQALEEAAPDPEPRPDLSSGPGAQPSTGGANEAQPSGSTDFLDCDADLDTPRASSCAIAPISCGDTITGSNAGQPSHFDDDFTRGKFCAPQTNKYGEAPEAVYALHLPEDTLATVTLDTPCADLDLFSVRWGNPQRCPGVGTGTGECEGSTKGARDQIRIMSVGRAEDHLVWVDGKRGATGNFSLKVECRAGR